MAGRPPNLLPIRKAFIDAINSAASLVEAARKLGTGFNPKVATKGLHPKHVRRIVELGFMGVVASWEEFVEAVFVRYLMGAAAPSGFTPTPRAGKTVSVGHSYQIVSGNPAYDPEKHYLRFSDAAWIVAQAKFFFDGGSPFDLSTTEIRFLRNAVSIRNRVAHASRKCKREFMVVADPILTAMGKKVWQSFRAGDLLLCGTPSLYEQYSSAYRDLATKIVPG